MHTSTPRHRPAVLVIVFAVFFAALTPPGSALAQAERSSGAPQAPNRGGFTLLLDMGVGFQINGFIDDSSVGYGGMNLGIGGFLTPDLALMFRVSGTNVRFDDVENFFGRMDVTSGVGGASLQYWANDFVNLEAGAGFAFASGDFWEDERGFGLIAAVGFSFFHRGKNSLQLGVEYAPAFLDAGNVHNVCITFGWQLL